MVAGNGTSGDTTQQTGSVSSAQTLPNVQNGGTITAKTTDQDPTGVVQAVSKLSVGELTEVGKMRSNNTNYYYIARLDAKDGEDIQYSLILIKLTKLDDDFAKLRADGKIEEYISVPESDEFDTDE